MKNKTNRPFYKKWWFWAIIILIIIVAAFSQTGKENSKTNDPNTSKNTNVTSTESSSKTTAEKTTAQKTDSTEQANPKTKIEFKNLITQNNLGITTVYGEVNNTDTKAHSFTVKVSFYDKNKKLLGSASGAVNNLNGGSSKIFTAISTQDYSSADSFKVQVDTLISTSENKEIPIELTNLVLNDNLGMVTVDGEAKNNDKSAHTFTISIGLYDANNKLLGVATGAVNDIAPGETMTFSAISTDSLKNVKSYKAFVDTIVK